MNDGAAVPPGNTPELKRFLDEAAAAAEALAELRPRNGDDDGRIKRLVEQARDEFAKLIKEVTSLSASVIDPDYLAANIRYAWRIVGRYTELAERSDQLAFVVNPVLDRAGLITDIDVAVREVPVPAGAAALKSEIDITTNVIRAVLGERARSFSPAFAKDTRADIARLQDDYLRQVLGIARVGLATAEPTRTLFAQADLVRVKNLFTLREAGIVKNAYVNLLGLCSLAVAVWFALLYAGAANPAACSTLLPPRFCLLAHELRNFAPLACGTAIGTWLSFSLRRQELSFTDLAVLEPDRLNPMARVVFMVGLSGLIGLLLYTGAVDAVVGPVSGTTAMRVHGSWALLLGLLSGVAERGLGAAVNRRSQDLATALGAAAPVAAVTVKA